MNPHDQQNYWQPQDEPEKQMQNDAGVVPPTSASPRTPDTQMVEWEASEAVENTKSMGWYIGFAVITLAVLGVTIYFREWIFAALVVVVAITIVIMSRRPPRVMHYVLNTQGLTIDGQLHSFAEFRAFGIVRDGAFFAIKLIPVRRFSPETTVYFAEQDGAKIVDILGLYLPMEEMRLHIVDKITRKMGL